MTDALRRSRPLIISALVIALALIWLMQQYEPRITASIVLSGLTLGALYFLVTSGLSLIFGLLDVLNFAQGLFFMLGAYIGYTLYANPRMILNTLPFALALGGAVMLGAALAALVKGRAPGASASRVISIALIVVGVLLVFAAVWGFDLLSLAASAATSAGGAIDTATAQEADGAYQGRILLLILAGLLLGVGMGVRQEQIGPQRRPAWRGPLVGVVAVALSFALIYQRTAGETFLVGLDSNLRFVLALVFGALAGALLGALVEWSMIRPLYVRPIYQVLLTLGLVLVGGELIKGIWGPTGFYMDMPAAFGASGAGCRPLPDFFSWFGTNCTSISIMGRPFPSYRLFVIGLGLVMFVVVAVLLQRTRLGMIIRAGVQDSEMVQALGINVRRVFTAVFALGTGLAALGGVAAAPFIGVNPGMGQEFLLLAFIAVVIGGMGSYSGAAIGALLVGLARAIGDQLVLTGIHLPWLDEALKFSPSVARASTVLLMVIVLLIRPAGLFGRKE